MEFSDSVAGFGKVRVKLGNVFVTNLLPWGKNTTFFWLCLFETGSHVVYTDLKLIDTPTFPVLGL